MAHVEVRKKGVVGHTERPGSCSTLAGASARHNFFVTSTCVAIGILASAPGGHDACLCHSRARIRAAASAGSGASPADSDSGAVGLGWVAFPDCARGAPSQIGIVRASSATTKLGISRTPTIRARVARVARTDEARSAIRVRRAMRCSFEKVPMGLVECPLGRSMLVRGGHVPRRPRDPDAQLGTNGIVGEEDDRLVNLGLARQGVDQEGEPGLAAGRDRRRQILDRHAGAARGRAEQPDRHFGVVGVTR